MNVPLTSFGQLRDLAGVAEETLEVDAGTTVASVLSSVASARGEGLRRLLMSGESVAPTILVALDEVQVTDAAATQITDGALLVVMAPMSGG